MIPPTRSTGFQFRLLYSFTFSYLISRACDNICALQILARTLASAVAGILFDKRVGGGRRDERWHYLSLLSEAKSLCACICVIRQSIITEREDNTITVQCNMISNYETTKCHCRRSINTDRTFARCYFPFRSTFRDENITRQPIPFRAYSSRS